MSPFLRKVKTASGATAVQIVEKRAGVRTIVEHLGSAHDKAGLAALLRVGQEKLHANQPPLELPARGGVRPGAAVIEGKRSQLLIDVVAEAWQRLGFDVIHDEAFFQLVLARLVEPTSKLDSLRVVADLGLAPVHLSTVKRCLKRCAEKDYRDRVALACFRHVWDGHGGDVSLLMYDVTTLYFETDTEDDLRRVGFSKERRVDPQLVIGLLVDRTGFPLEIACFEGSKPETQTIIPVIQAFQTRHGVADMVVVADAGMLSAANLKAIDEAGLRFIVGSRMTKAPHDLAKHFHWHGDAFTDGQIIDTITMRSTAPDPARIKTRAEPVWTPTEHPTAWRVIWHYSRKRAVRDHHTLTAQRNRAQAVVDGDKPAKKVRFVKTTGQESSLDQASLDRAERLVGLKGYVTNITAAVMPPAEVLANYHDLWHVEQSFRMSKSDLAARPIYHHLKDSIEAHLTIVFTALAIARDLQARSGWSLKRIIHTLRPLQQITIRLAGQQLHAEPAIPDDVAQLLASLGH